MRHKLLGLLLAALLAVPALAQTQGDHHVKGVYSKKSPVYNVKNRAYGAVGDGATGAITTSTCAAATDDQPAIALAITDMLADDLDGSVLFFPPGIYCVDERVVIGAHSNYKIMGENATIVINDNLNDSVTANSDAFFKITSASNLEISGLKIIDPDSTAHNGTSEQTHGVICDACQDVMIDNVWIEGMGDECIDFYDTVTGSPNSVVNNITIQNSHFKDCAELDANGSSVGIRKGSNIKILNNNFEGTSIAGAQAISVDCPTAECSDTVFRDIQIIGNHILNAVSDAILVGNADSIGTGIKINHNIIRSCGKNGIRVAGSVGGTNERMEIVGNTIEDCGDSMVDAADGGGIFVSAGASADGAGIVAHNIIDQFGLDADTNNHYGILIKSGGWVISNNVITNSKAGAIRSTTTNDPNLIVGNHIITSAGTGIYAVNADQVAGNQIQASPSGVYFDSGVKGGFVSNNVIDGSTTTGIRLNGTQELWATGNIITDSGYGITGSGSTCPGSDASTCPKAAGNAVINPTTANYNGSFSTAMEFGPELDLAHNLKVFTANHATPNVKDGSFFRTANTTLTTLTDFDYGEGIVHEAGHVVWVHFDEITGGSPLTIVDFTGGSNFKGNAGIDWTPQNDESMLCIAGATDWYCIVSDVGGAGGGAGAFDDASDPVVMNNRDKDVLVGQASFNTSKFEIDGDADQVQFSIQAFDATPPDSLMIVEKEDGTEIFNIDYAGDVLMQSIQDIDGPGTLWKIDAAGAATFFSITTGVSGTPGIDFKDNDNDVAEVNCEIDVNCTTTATTAEDCDYKMRCYYNGSMVTLYEFDADSDDGGAGTAADIDMGSGLVGTMSIGGSGVTDISIVTDGVTVTEADLAIIADSLIDLTSEVSGIAPVANGGTGVASPTDNTLIVGNGSSATTETNAGTNGQLLIAATGADPAFATLSVSPNELELASTGANSLTIGIETDPIINAVNFTGLIDVETIVIKDPTAATHNAVIDFPCSGAGGCTITKIWCSTDTGTVTMNLEERVETTPNTAGVDMLSAALVCDTNSQSSCASGCDVNTIQNQPVDRYDPISLQVDLVTSTPGWVRIHVEMERE